MSLISNNTVTAHLIFYALVPSTLPSNKYLMYNERMENGCLALLSSCTQSSPTGEVTKCCYAVINK